MENIVSGRCFTNLDDYDTSIVTKFYNPHVGELVHCRYKGNVSNLRIVQILHDQKDDKPFLIIELHK